MQKVTLKSLIEESKDGEWGKGEPNSQLVEMRVIRGTDFEGIRGGETNHLPIRYIKETIAKRKTLRKNDILIETAGGSKDRPTGRTAYINSSIISKSDLPLTCASFSRFIRINPTKACPHYIYLHLQYLYKNRVLLKYHTQHTGVARFQWTTFSTTEELLIPSEVKTQQKIASILSAYDELIENNTRQIKILEEMAQLIYREWFVKFKFPGHENVPMVESELGLIPEGWEVKQIGKLIETVGGGTPSTKKPEYWEKGDLNWYTPKNLTTENTLFMIESEKKITNLGLQKSSAKLFPAYSVMMTSRATIGVVAINTNLACTNQGFITCIPNDNLSVYEIYYCILENIEQINSVASGATFKEINKSVFRNLLIAIPPSFIREKFIALIKPFFENLEKTQIEIKDLRQTRDLLLPKLISGEIDVEGLNIKIGGEAA